MPERIAWVDAGAGVAGDMLLAALIDAGADLAVVRHDVDAVLPGTVSLRTEQVRRAGLRSLALTVRLGEPDQPHRPWRELRDRLVSADLPSRVRRDALAVFTRLAEAEAHEHAVPVEEVHFHEVGAWDSVADVVGVCAALADLGIDRLSVGPIAVGSGRIPSAHGDLPVPVPAVARMMTGWTVFAGGDGELATPTGVALLTALADTQRDLPHLDVVGVGVGAGQRDTAARANVVRVVVGLATAPMSTDSATDAASDPVTAGEGVEDLRVLEANVDDLDPRVWPTVIEALLAVGALDAWLVPVVMKKGRPAVTVSALAAPDRVAAVVDTLLQHTPTLGVRLTAVRRVAAPRRTVTVALPDDARAPNQAGARDGNVATVRVKIGFAGGTITTVTPEFEDCVALARSRGLPVRRVLDQARAVAAASGWRPGAGWDPAPPGDASGGADGGHRTDGGHRADGGESQ